MEIRPPKLHLIGYLLTLIISQYAIADTLSGQWQCPPGGSNLIFEANGTLVFDGEKSQYQLSQGNILIAEDYGWQPYPYQLSQNQLSIQFPDGSLLQCVPASSNQSSRQNNPANPIASQQPNNAQLQQDIAGIWWGYSGSTEKKIGLCPDGTYKDYTESSYGGSGYNAYGDQTMAWGAGSQQSNQGIWSIQGDYQSGTISVQTQQGGQFQWHYQQIGDPGCLNISGSKLCRSSAHCN